MEFLTSPGFIYSLPVLFAMAFIWMIMRTKNLTSIDLEPDEKILYTDEKCTFMMNLNKRAPSMRPRGVLEITNKRLLCYQKALFSNKRVVAFTVDYTGSKPPTPMSDFMGGAMFKKGYLELVTSKEKFRYEDHKGKEKLVFDLIMDKIPLNYGTPHIEIRSDQVMEYKKHLQ